MLCYVILRHHIQLRLGPQTMLGELTVLPRPLVGFKEPTSKGRNGWGSGLTEVTTDTTDITDNSDRN